MSRKSYTGLSIAFGDFRTVNAQSSKLYTINTSDSIPTLSLKEIVFSSSTLLEDGVICKAIADGTQVIKLMFTNIKGTNVTLSDKTFSLFIM